MDLRPIIPILIQAVPVVATLLQRALKGIEPSDNDLAWYDNIPGLEEVAALIRNKEDLPLRAQVETLLADVGTPEGRLKKAIAKLKAN